jgi:hypothetical protein
MLSEVVHSLEEAVHEVDSDVEDLTFTGVFLIVKEVDGVSLRVVYLEEFIYSSTLLVWMVNVESLEVEEIELAGWEFVEGVSFLLFGSLLTFFFFFSLSRSLRLRLSFLFLR